MQDEIQPSNIAKVQTLFEGMNLKDAALATKYIDPRNFVNHNPQAADGIEGVRAFVAHLPAGGNISTIVRVIEDGPYVVTHSHGDIFGEKVFFDIFRIENGSIVEHWDNLAEVTPPNESGHTSIDGPTTITDVNKTEGNKMLVRRFYEAIFLEAQFHRMPEFFDGDAFIRHDARGGDGLSSLNNLMQQQAQQGTTMAVSKIHHVLGQGNFVLVTAEGSINEKPVAYYDLFRIQSDKIAEHWNVIESIPSQDQSRNQNGKF